MTRQLWNRREGQRSLPCTLDGAGIRWLRVCIVGVPLVAVLVTTAGARVSGPWWLELLCLDDQWALWAVVPFEVDQDGALSGEGIFVLTPAARNDLGTDARGTIRISGRLAEGGFDLDAISFSDYELGQGDSLTRRMTVLQLEGYGSAWEDREALEECIEALEKAERAEIQAKDGAEAGFDIAVGGQVYLVLHRRELLPLTENWKCLSTWSDACGSSRAGSVCASTAALFDFFPPRL